MNYIQLSQEILQVLKCGKSTNLLENTLARSTEEELNHQLQTDNQKIAFWVNIYNAFIQIKLKEKPDKYDKRTQFFAEKFIAIAGRNMSFSNIEHGIIRGSQWQYGFGRIRNPFAPQYQKKFSPKKREARVHFALNCGAKSCPPVTIYNPEHLDAQLEYMSANFLKKNTTFNKENEEVTTTVLFSWFRGDFGGKKGIKRMLFHYNLIPNKDVRLQFGDYDWTLYLNNFIEIP
ncbi:MAG: DUF547 domain-containing protein [Saprospiraceae bacterium]